MTFRGLGFSGTQLSGFRFVDCQFVDCRFDGATLDDWRWWGSLIEDCSFHEAKLAGGMGGDRRHPDTWRRVHFTRADLRHSSHHVESYDDCNFRDAGLKRVHFDGSRHRNSHFAVRIDEVEFRATPLNGRRTRNPNTMSGVDLRAATVRYRTFYKIDLSGCLLPASPEHLRFDNHGHFAARVLETAQQAGNDNASLRIMMEGHMYDAVDGGGGPGFQHRDDLGDTEEERASAEALLRSLGAR